MKRYRMIVLQITLILGGLAAYDAFCLTLYLHFPGFQGSGSEQNCGHTLEETVHLTLVYRMKPNATGLENNSKHSWASHGVSTWMNTEPTGRRMRLFRRGLN